MAKKRKNERKKKLKSLVLLLFLTILLLSTSTYAWFTANRSVSIDAINVNVTAVSGLQISTDASEWKTLINNNDIRTPSAYTTNKNMLPTVLSPVSTAGTTTGAYLNMYKGTVAGDQANGGQMSLTSAKCPAEAAGTTGDFVAFDIFLKADEAGQVYLENGSGVTVNDGTVGTVYGGGSTGRSVGRDAAAFGDGDCDEAEDGGNPCDGVPPVV